jgi:DNA-directed RNA polymerase specialized sigma24 family protein
MPGSPHQLELVFLPDLDRQVEPIAWEEPWYQERVRLVLARSLTHKQREVVERYYFRGQTEAAIAADLGIRQQVVHKRIHGVLRGGRRIGGALARLRAALTPIARAQRWE